MRRAGGGSEEGAAGRGERATIPSLRPRTRWLGRECEWLRATGSTNDDVLARARAGAAHGLVVLAEEQRRGRGRMGRSWHSPPGDNLTFSVLLRFDRPPSWAPPLTLAAGVAVCDALLALGCRASIKWPNDVVIDGKKVAGVLTETSTQGGRLEAIALGIGVNVNLAAFPSELEPIATSIRLALGHPVDRGALAETLLERLEGEVDRYHREGAQAVAAAWRARPSMLGRPVRVVVEGTVREGVATRLDDECALWVQPAAGPAFRVVSGEVTAP